MTWTVAMKHASRIQRKQLMQQAEGYLDLIFACDELLTLDDELRDRMARLALSNLVQIEDSQGHRARILYLKGQAYRAMRQYAEAVGPLEQAAELDPENVHIYLALGWCYKRSKRLDLAIESLERSLEYDYEIGIVHYNLACYWAISRNPKLAVSYLTTAFEIDSSLRDLVRDEPDFNSIRNHPDFLAIMSVIV